MSPKKEDARKIVSEIRRDRRRGATPLADRALDAMALDRSLADELETLRPSMILIGAAVRLARKKGVRSARRALNAALRGIARTAKEYLPAEARYLSFGGGATIAAVLDAVRAARVRALPADVALVGADAVFPGGDFLNAKGTAAFARKARRAGAAVYVVASDLKRTEGKVSVERGFERVPGHVVHAFLSESGIAYPESGALGGVEPTWLERGPVSVRGTGGRCHPHH